jgi:hypothetical protein
MADKQRQALLLVVLIWLALFALVLVGVKRSAMNGQPWDLWLDGYSPWTALLALDKHALRYAVYWPIFLISEGVGVHPDRLFGFFSAGASLLLAWTMVKSDFLLSPHPSLWRSAAYALMVVFLSLLIEGRITLLLTGYAMLIWAALHYVVCGRWNHWQTTALLAGGALSSLSSGTLAVAGAFVGLFALWLFLQHRRPLDHPIAMTGSFLLFFISYGGWIIAGVIINLEFFDNSAIAMLNHGLGRIALMVGSAGLLALGLAGLAGAAVFWWLYRRQSAGMFILTIAIAPAAAGGLFGLTTLSVGLVPLLLMARYRLWRELLPLPFIGRSSSA